MKDIVNEYMKHNRATDWFGVKRLHCNDGFSMSVQAHDGAYCSPRVDPADTDYYFEVEVGFPSEREELLMEYVEDYDNPTKTVYGYVPVEVVQEVIEKHGGMKENNEVVQGTDTARGTSASGADLSVGAVLSVLKDTKKINAGIALVCLGSYLEDGMITQEQFERIRVLADRGKNTPIAKESETNDVEYIEQSIAYLEEYLQEQGV